MLQQTQVQRVIPRYLAWLERWPSVDALAEASTGDVIRAWQGLGYNRRALALHRAARRVAAEGWPDDLTELPGVGAYTASAIRNFAFGEPALPVDVNVARVLRRTRFTFSPTAAQALMDLGATTCLARVPRCGTCPLEEGCPSRGMRANRRGSRSVRRLVQAASSTRASDRGRQPAACDGAGRRGRAVTRARRPRRRRRRARRPAVLSAQALVRSNGGAPPPGPRAPRRGR